MSEATAAHLRLLLRQMIFDPASFDDYGRIGDEVEHVETEEHPGGVCFIVDDDLAKKKQATTAKRGIIKTKSSAPKSKAKYCGRALDAAHNMTK